jgi:uncharacterized membrane protein HdeD (DUF308 family)
MEKHLKVILLLSGTAAVIIGAIMAFSPNVDPFLRICGAVMLLGGGAQLTAAILQHRHERGKFGP